MMINYLISSYIVYYFFLVAVISYFCQKRYPFLCFVLWIFVLIKLLLPFGFHDLKILNIEHPVYSESAKLIDSFYSKNSDHQNAIHHPPQIISGTKNIYDQNSVSLTNHNSTGLDIYTNYSTFGFLQNTGMIWFSVSFLLFLLYSISYFRFFKIINAVSPTVSGEIYDLFKSCCQQVGLSSIPKLRIASHVHLSPFTIGFYSKTCSVVLPESILNECSTKDLKILFTHELCHIKSNDQWLGILRFICFCLFHIHPIRIIADKQLVKFQEINRDLEAIRILNIPQKEYAKTLISIYFDVVKDKKAPILCTGFLGINSGFVERIQFIKENIRPLTVWNKIANSILFIVCLILLFANPATFGMLFQEQSINLSNLNQALTFNKPILHKTLSADPAAKVKVFQDKVWIAEPNKGLFIYQLNNVGEFNLVSEYQIQSNGDHQINDFDVNENMVAAAIGNSNIFYQTGEKRIEILLFENNTFKVKNIIDDYHAFTVQFVDGVLWTSGVVDVSNNTLLTAMSQYKIQDVAIPELIDEVYLEVLPREIKHFSTISNDVFLLYDTNIEVFANQSPLQSKQLLNIGSTVRSIAINANGQLFVSSDHVQMNSTGFGAKITPVISEIIINSNSEIEIDKQVKFNHEMYNNNLGITSLIPYLNGVFLVLNQPGFGFLESQQSGFQIPLWDERQIINGFVLADQLYVFDSDLMYQFSIRDLINQNSLIANWKGY